MHSDWQGFDFCLRIELNDLPLELKADQAEFKRYFVYWLTVVAAVESLSAQAVISAEASQESLFGLVINYVKGAELYDSCSRIT